MFAAAVDDDEEMSEQEKPPAYFSGHQEFDQVVDLSQLVEAGYRYGQASAGACTVNSFLRKFASQTRPPADFGSNLATMQMR